VLHLPFSEGVGTSVKDTSQYRNNGVFGAGAAAPSWVAGREGRRALSFDGGDYVDCGNPAILQFERTDAFSITAWIKRDVIDAAHMIVTKETHGGNYEGYTLYIKADNKVSMLIVSTLANMIETRETTGSLTTTGTWYFVAMTYDGSSTAAGVKLYVSGRIQPVSYIVDSLDASILTTAHVNIGSRDNGNIGMLGDINTPKIWNRLLSINEIHNLYNLRGLI